jgi:hypothetical protein
MLKPQFIVFKRAIGYKLSARRASLAIPDMSIGTVARRYFADLAMLTLLPVRM